MFLNEVNFWHNMFKKLISGLAAVSITFAALLPVSAQAATSGSNLVPNSSLEIIQNANTPADWQSSSWGTNTATFKYLNTGHTGNHSIQVNMTSYSSGDANWYYNDVPVTAGTTYEFSDWYQSDVDTEVDAEVIVNGTPQYFSLGTPFASDTWTKYTTTFTIPQGGTAMSIYQLINKVGTLTTDDYSLGPYNPAPFNRAIVSVSFDDGWVNQLDNAEPVLQQYHIPGTYNIISNEMTNPDEAGYMTSQQVLGLYNDGNGNEIASHTVHHCDLTGKQTDNPQNCPLPISAQQVHDEMFNSKTALESLINAPVTDFAYPYGAYDAATITVGEQAGYLSQRTVNSGYNTKDNFDPTQLKIYEVDSNITPAQVQAWVHGAITDKAWLILVYHEVATTASDPSDSTYLTQPSDFSTEMAYIHSTGVMTETVATALAETSQQANGDVTPPVISNIASSLTTDSTSMINWTTDEPSTTQVAYGITSGYGTTTTPDNALVTAHSASLNGLAPGTTYHYQVISTDTAGNTAVSPDTIFTTAPAQPPAVTGDVNGDGTVNILDLSIVLTNWEKTNASLSQGDVTGDGIVNVFDLSTILTNWSM